MAAITGVENLSAAQQARLDEVQRAVETAHAAWAGADYHGKKEAEKALNDALKVRLELRREIGVPTKTENPEVLRMRSEVWRQLQSHISVMKSQSGADMAETGEVDSDAMIAP